MPALTISAVDAGADTLTITGHGQVTGAGPAAIYTDGGTIPSGLAAVTDYWLIVVDANTVKLASSSANALAGTPIDITSTGSGTLLLLLGLPYRVPRTATAGQQVKSADLNAVWLTLVALWNLLTGQAQSIWTKVKLAVSLVLSANQSITLSGTGDYYHGDRELTFSGAGYQANHATVVTYSFGAGPPTGTRVSASAAATFFLPIPMLVGDRIKSITFSHLGDGAVDITAYDVYKTTAAGIDASIGNGSITNVGSSWASTSLDVTDTQLATGEALTFIVVANATGLSLGNVRVVFDRPPP